MCLCSIVQINQHTISMLIFVCLLKYCGSTIVLGVPKSWKKFFDRTTQSKNLMILVECRIFAEINKELSGVNND